MIATKWLCFCLFDSLFFPDDEDMYDAESNDAVSCDPLEMEQTKDGYRLVMDVPSKFFGYIIGQKGETRKRIEHDTGTHLDIPKAHTRLEEISKLMINLTLALETLMLNNALNAFQLKKKQVGNQDKCHPGAFRSPLILDKTLHNISQIVIPPLTFSSYSLKPQDSFGEFDNFVLDLQKVQEIIRKHHQTFLQLFGMTYCNAILLNGKFSLCT